ncbi:MAG: LysR family transcriptional regulator [Clostridia bacterium]|nr:LysR family transcriptional regulator [Clostridia bacterium]
MELAKLRYFYQVAKMGNVTKAADEIHIAQPALTKAVKQLEEELGAPLFYKKGRNIYLTEFGVYLQRRLEELLPQVDGLAGEIEHLKGERRRTVKLNVLTASTAVTEAVVEYKKKHRGAVFQLIQNEAETDCDVSVRLGGADFGAFAKPLTEMVLEEEIYLAVPKNSPYAERESIALGEVKDEWFVHLAGSRPFRAVCDGFCAAAGFSPKTSFESDSPTAVKNIIGANAGVGFWPEYTWGRVSADVKLLHIQAPVCKRSIVVSLHESPFPSAVAEDFFAYLTQKLQNKKKRHGKNV